MNYHNGYLFLLLTACVAACTSGPEASRSSGGAQDLAGVGAPPGPPAEPPTGQVESAGVDLLVVIDNADSMAEEQLNLMAQIGRVLSTIEAAGAGLRVATVTRRGGQFFTQPADVTVAGQLVRDIPDAFCDGVVASSRGGVLDPADPTLRQFIEGFGPIPDFTGRATGVFQDDNQDKIADNLIAPNFADAVGCLLSVGTEGGGSETALCNAAAALDPESLAAGGGAFLGDPQSVLALVIVSDEDDRSPPFTVTGGKVSCGVPTSADGSVFGGLSRQQDVCGTDQTGALGQLAAVGDLAARFKAVRGDGQLFVATITGPPGNAAPDCTTPFPAPACFNAQSGAASPGNRYFDFAQLFLNKLDALDVPICDDFGPTVGALGGALGAVLPGGCPKAPKAGQSSPKHCVDSAPVPNAP